MVGVPKLQLILLLKELQKIAKNRSFQDLDYRDKLRQVYVLLSKVEDPEVHEYAAKTLLFFHKRFSSFWRNVNQEKGGCTVFSQKPYKSNSSFKGCLRIYEESR